MNSYPLRLPEDVKSKAKEKANGRYLNIIISILIDIWLSGNLTVDGVVNSAYKSRIKELRKKQISNLPN